MKDEFPFKRFSVLVFKKCSFEQKMQILEDSEKLGIMYDYVRLEGYSCEELEKFTNPNLFKNGIIEINYLFRENHQLTDIYFNNIKHIQPKTLSFESVHSAAEAFDFIKIFKGIPRNTNIKFDNKFSMSDLKFSFKNVPIKIEHALHNDHLFINCEAFTFYLDIEDLNSYFWCSSKVIDKDKSQVYLHIKDYVKYEFDGVQIIDSQEEIKEFESIFPENSKHSENYSKSIEDNESKDYCIIIPISYLYEVEINMVRISDIISGSSKKKFISDISCSPNFKLSINYSSDLSYLKECISLFQLNCKYELSCYDNIEDIDQLVPLPCEEAKEMLDNISKIRLSCLYISSELSPTHYSFISKVLSLPKTQVYLNICSLTLVTLSDALKVLELLSDCINISFIVLFYTSVESIENPDELIRQAKIEFLISKLSYCKCKIYVKVLLYN